MFFPFPFQQTGSAAPPCGCSSCSARSAQLSAYSTGWKGSSSSRHGLAEHMAHHVGLGVAALVHGSAADEIEQRGQPLLFQNGGHDLGRLGGGGTQEVPGLLQAAQHFGGTGVSSALVAALGCIAHAVQLGGFLDLGRIGEVLAEASAQRRAEVAAEVDPGGVHSHPGKDFFQCIENAGGGIDQGPVHIKQNSIVFLHLHIPHFHGDTVYSIAQIGRISNSNKRFFWVLCKFSGSCRQTKMPARVPGRQIWDITGCWRCRCRRADSTDCWRRTPAYP